MMEFKKLPIKSVHFVEVYKAKRGVSGSNAGV